MKKILLLSSLFVLLLAGCGTPDEQAEEIPSEGPLQIMASFYPLAHFTEQVGGDLVEVTNMTPVGGEPHDYEPSPRELALLQEADLFLFLGAGLEPWAEDVEHNLDKVNSLEMSSYLDLIKDEKEHDEDADEQQEEEADEHQHGDMDPHVWLDPILVQQQVEVIRDTLKKIDPDHANAYDQGADQFLAELRQLDADFTAALSNCMHEEALVSHDAYTYLGERYGIHFHAISGLSPQSEPSAKHLADLTDLAREEGIQHIFFETLVSPKLAQTLADEVGAGTLVLNPLEGLTSEQIDAGVTYISVMRENLNNLTIALQCQ